MPEELERVVALMLVSGSVRRRICEVLVETRTMIPTKLSSTTTGMDSAMPTLLPRSIVAYRETPTTRAEMTWWLGVMLADRSDLSEAFSDFSSDADCARRLSCAFWRSRSAMILC